MSTYLKVRIASCIVGAVVILGAMYWGRNYLFLGDRGSSELARPGTNAGSIKAGDAVRASTSLSYSTTRLLPKFFYSLKSSLFNMGLGGKLAISGAVLAGVAFCIAVAVLALKTPAAVPAGDPEKGEGGLVNGGGSKKDGKVTSSSSVEIGSEAIWAIVGCSSAVLLAIVGCVVKFYCFKSKAVVPEQPLKDKGEDDRPTKNGPRESRDETTSINVVIIPEVGGGKRTGEPTEGTAVSTRTTETLTGVTGSTTATTTLPVNEVGSLTGESANGATEPLFNVVSGESAVLEFTANTVHVTTLIPNQLLKSNSLSEAATSQLEGDRLAEEEMPNPIPTAPPIPERKVAAKLKTSDRPKSLPFGPVVTSTDDSRSTETPTEQQLVIIERAEADATSTATPIPTAPPIPERIKSKARDGPKVHMSTERNVNSGTESEQTRTLSEDKIPSTSETLCRVDDSKSTPSTAESLPFLEVSSPSDCGPTMTPPPASTGTMYNTDPFLTPSRTDTPSRFFTPSSQFTPPQNDQIDSHVDSTAAVVAGKSDPASSPNSPGGGGALFRFVRSRKGKVRGQSTSPPAPLSMIPSKPQVAKNVPLPRYTTSSPANANL
jgi:hypothetical protein